MAGAEASAESEDWYMAHLMWQRHGMRLEDWAELPRHIQLAYIASEELEKESPVSPTDRIAKGLLTSNNED